MIFFAAIFFLLDVNLVAGVEKGRVSGHFCMFDVGLEAQMRAVLYVGILLDPLTAPIHNEKYSVHWAVTLPVQKLSLLQVQFKAVVTVQLLQLMPTKRLKYLKVHAYSRRLIHFLLQTVTKYLLINFLTQPRYRHLRALRITRSIPRFITKQRIFTKTVSCFKHHLFRQMFYFDFECAFLFRLLS